LIQKNPRRGPAPPPPAWSARQARK